jgi:hypothetical protein
MVSGSSELPPRNVTLFKVFFGIENVRYPIYVTDAGIVTEVKAVYLKALSPIVLSVDGSETLARFTDE